MNEVIDEQPIAVDFNKKFEEVKKSPQFQFPVNQYDDIDDGTDDWMSNYYDW